MKPLTDSIVAATFVVPSFLCWPCAIAASAGVPVTSASAATPVSGAVTAVPAPYHFNVGTIDCWVLYDTQSGYEPASFFVNALPAELAPVLRQSGANTRKIFTPYASLLVKTPTNTVLIDTGAESFVGATKSHLQASLAAAGVTREQIDTVLLTHAHADHIGGTLRADGQPAFSRARFVMFKQEWDFWTQGTPDLSTLAIPDTGRKLFVEIARKQLLPLRDRMELIERDTEVRPGIFALLAAGHTPGHMVVKIGSQGGQLLYVADLVLSPIALEHPEWHSKYELDVAASQATKRRMLARAADERMLVYAMHFPWPGLGHVAAAGDHWTWRPVAVAP